MVLRHEGGVPYERIFSEEATCNLVVLHGGSGDEDDQLLVQKLVEDRGALIKDLDIIPGTSFGLIRVERPEDASKVMERQDEGVAGLYSLELGGKRP